jgi:hypothetical protein
VTGENWNVTHHLLEFRGCGDKSEQGILKSFLEEGTRLAGRIQTSVK